MERWKRGVKSDSVLLLFASRAASKALYSLLIFEVLIIPSKVNAAKAIIIRFMKIEFRLRERIKGIKIKIKRFTTRFMSIKILDWAVIPPINLRVMSIEP